MVRLRVPTPTNGTLKRFFSSVCSDVDDEALLVRECLSTRGADMWALITVGPAVLGQHGFRQKVGATLADKGTIAGM